MKYDLNANTGPFGGFDQTRTQAETAEVLRGHYSPEKLAALAKQVSKAVNRRRRTKKAPNDLQDLLGLLLEASHPPALDVPTQIFRTATGGEPLAVRLCNTEEIVTVIPPGAAFVIPAGVEQFSHLFIRPAGGTGPDNTLVTAGVAGDVVHTPRAKMSSPPGTAAIL